MFVRYRPVKGIDERNRKKDIKREYQFNHIIYVNIDYFDFTDIAG